MRPESIQQFELLPKEPLLGRLNESRRLDIVRAMRPEWLVWGKELRKAHRQWEAAVSSHISGSCWISSKHNLKSWWNRSRCHHLLLRTFFLQYLHSINSAVLLHVSDPHFVPKSFQGALFHYSQPLLAYLQPNCPLAPLLPPPLIVQEIVRDKDWRRY